MIKNLVAVVLVTSSMHVVAQTFEDIDLSGIPNAFVNGTTADADDVNANFQYLQDNLATLVSILQAQGTIAPTANKFAGNYELNGIEVTLEAGTCEVNLQQNLIVTQIAGTASSDGSTLSLSTTDASGEMRALGFGTTLLYTTGSDTDGFSIDANGGITGVGRFSQDGSSFYASATDSVTNGGCDEINIAYVTGVRTN